jgi:hypothetical protein
LFFRIERTGPPGGGPARSFLPVRCPHPSHSRLVPGRASRDHTRWPFIGPAIPSRLPFAQSRGIVSRSSWIYPPAPAKGQTPPRATRSYVPRSQRLRRRRFAPSTRIARHPCLAPSLSLTASHPRVGTGNVSRPLLRVGPAIPPPTPTPAHGTHCPPLGRAAAKRLRRERLRRERLRRNQCPARLFGSSAECTFPSPTLRFCSLCFSALPACQID